MLDDNIMLCYNVAAVHNTHRAVLSVVCVCVCVCVWCCLVYQARRVSCLKYLFTRSTIRTYFSRSLSINDRTYFLLKLLNFSPCLTPNLFLMLYFNKYPGRVSNTFKCHYASVDTEICL